MTPMKQEAADWQARHDAAAKDANERRLRLNQMFGVSLSNYDLGHARGLREGRDSSNAYEQDFAYQHEEYTRGYWDGYKQGVKEQK
jgi:hypothetical protein